MNKTFTIIFTFKYFLLISQNPFPQNDLYKSLDIAVVQKSSKSTYDNKPISLDNIFEINDEGLIEKEILFPENNWRREKFLYYKSDTILLEEISYGLRGEYIESQLLYSYDAIGRLVEIVEYVLDEKRSKIIYHYVGDTKNLNQKIKQGKYKKDTCNYYYSGNLIDSIYCVNYRKAVVEDTNTDKEFINNTTTKFKYDSKGHILTETEISDDGKSHNIKKYQKLLPNKEPLLISHEELIYRGSNNKLRLKKYSYDERGKLVSYSSFELDSSQKEKTSNYHFYYNSLGLLEKRESFLNDGTILYLYFEYK